MTVKKESNEMDNKVIVTGIITEEDDQYITIETENHEEVVIYVINYPTLAKNIKIGNKVTAEGYLKRKTLDANSFCAVKINKVK